VGVPEALRGVGIARRFGVPKTTGQFNDHKALGDRMSTRGSACEGSRRQRVVKALVHDLYKVIAAM
jgi:hypothetical protein